MGNMAVCKAVHRELLFKVFVHE